MATGSPLSAWSKTIGAKPPKSPGLAVVVNSTTSRGSLRNTASSVRVSSESVPIRS